MTTSALGPSRRNVLAASALAAISGGALADVADNRSLQTKGTKLLVAYFTRSGNTRVVAGTIHRALGTNIFEIKPQRPYPDDYEQTVKQARQERDRDEEPTLAEHVTKISAYQAIFLGFPIWGETAPPIIRAFLSKHDTAGKTIRPFITHGGFGLGNSLSVLASHAPQAHIEPAFVMEADQERRTLDQVRGWLQKIKGATP